MGEGVGGHNARWFHAIISLRKVTATGRLQRTWVIRQGAVANTSSQCLECKTNGAKEVCMWE